MGIWFAGAGVNADVWPTFSRSRWHRNLMQLHQTFDATAHLTLAPRRSTLAAHGRAAPDPVRAALAPRPRRAGRARIRSSICRCARSGGRAPSSTCRSTVHGHRAQTPVGPAAGPHAQLAQNIVLAWLGGSRVIELKTVQVLDELKIPRPCIDAATIGFNVEWSQELKLAESLREYVAGWMLMRILRAARSARARGRARDAAEPVFELSVGYDLKGLQAPAMRDYLTRCAERSAPIVDELRAHDPARAGAAARSRLSRRPGLVRHAVDLPRLSARGDRGDRALPPRARSAST